MTGCIPPKGTVATQRPDLHVYNGASEVQPAPEPDEGVNPDATEMHDQCGYVDVAALLDDGIPEPPAPGICKRRDGTGIFYARQYNVVFGDPESGKTLLCDFATVEALAEGGRVLRLDLDHNGPESTVSRLIDFGADEDTLRDPDRFLYVEPVDRVQMARIVEHMETWQPVLVIVDSIGELMPLYGAGSNSADEFTDVHTRVIKPLTRTGACVVAIDHLSKGADSRKFGATGTAAKKRAIGGTSIRVTVDSAFTPDKGGSAYLAIHKDRHGGLRRRSPGGDREPLAGKFTILGDERFISAPDANERNPAERADPEDVAAMDALEPPPKSARDARERLKWNDSRTRLAYRNWKDLQ
ncbi:AAA family ATPase [Gordonia sp. ABSL49_1]|uniref:AAA family ATPase n=1 Tax=Gordonia sp. ABSL49_1 TaxID=2920941 RepID=UPI001F0EC123|nr:AAA family ATPase [Gordonia sp. ABSL49_1]MCH5641428.1 AAA family ATPase [Gordonia sp. ABSL49_1]